MRVDFVANASHELRTPLAALSGFIETLKGRRATIPPRASASSTSWRRRPKRMARLIDDLLSLSRIELSAHVRPQTPVEFAADHSPGGGCAARCWARDRGVTVTICRAHGATGRVRRSGRVDAGVRKPDRERLEIRCVGQAREITLSRAFECRRGGEEAVAAVRDYGPGISGEHLPRLTERFYRVDVSESRARRRRSSVLAGQAHPEPPSRSPQHRKPRRARGATFTVRRPDVHQACRWFRGKIADYSMRLVCHLIVMGDVIEAEACHP